MWPKYCVLLILLIITAFHRYQWCILKYISIASFSLEKLAKWFSIPIYSIGFYCILIDFALYHAIRIFLVGFLPILDHFLFLHLDHHNYKTAMTFLVTSFFFPSWGQVSAYGSWLFTFFENLQPIILWAWDGTRSKNNSPFQIPSRTENGKSNHLEHSVKTRCGLAETPLNLLFMVYIRIKFTFILQEGYYLTNRHEACWNYPSFGPDHFDVNRRLI